MSKTGWLLTALGTSVAGCCALGGLLVLVGADTSEAPKAAAAAVAGRVASRAPAAGEDDFLFVTSEGLTYVSTANVVARGQRVTLAGLWRDDRDNFSLRLDGDGSYELQGSGGSSGGGALRVESGSWSAEGGGLRLTPASVSLQTVHLPSKHQEDKGEDAGGPRDYAIDGLGLEYAPYGRPGAAVRRIDGLSISGPAAPWAYEPSGQWAKTLRRAPR